MGQCSYCGKEIEPPVYRTTVCPSCGKDVKICLNCRFYSPGSHYDCSESISDPVRDKERANFCDFFQFGSNYREGSVKDRSRGGADAFNKLFGD